ncbi:SDR family oxidoreductase [Salinisphaera sp. P385]|uniref:SDR family oxidoreductase n=1 Tax=Spectribacter acetivorans TaxID=3075603 RepID=A0ABU3BDW2_9GAMM|nr:SDR family oxidoreductase [Salinisphaera sp. P385]MDT0619531.1 SDR family oxidoreductase [Salinisphaera sp. P385]
MSQTIAITGANRGIGLEMARLWRERGERVIAVCREPSEALQALNVDIIDGIDVGRDADMPRLSEALADTRIDVLYNNAGVMHSETLDDMDFGRIREQFEVNALGPLRVTMALIDRLPSGGKIGLMTSRMGSMEDNDSGRKYGYRISKAGLNAAGKSLAVDLADRGIAVAILHPGWVRTNMTGHSGHLEPAESAALLIQRMDELDMPSSGTFWHAEGQILPW